MQKTISHNSMSRNLLEVYLADIRFLIGLKKSTGRLNNRIHDNLALIAIDHFKQKFPNWEFHYANAGAAGIDIIGKDKDELVVFVGEVKTTLPDKKGNLRGPQQKGLQRDLERLSSYSGNVERCLILLSRATKEAVEKQLHSSENFSTVTLFNALNESVTEEEDEGES